MQRSGISCNGRVNLLTSIQSNMHFAGWKLNWKQSTLKQSENKDLGSKVTPPHPHPWGFSSGVLKMAISGDPMCLRWSPIAYETLFQIAVDVINILTIMPLTEMVKVFVTLSVMRWGTFRRAENPILICVSVLRYWIECGLRSEV